MAIGRKAPPPASEGSAGPCAGSVCRPTEKKRSEGGGDKPKENCTAVQQPHSQQLHIYPHAAILRLRCIEHARSSYVNYALALVQASGAKLSLVRCLPEPNAVGRRSSALQ